MNDNTIKPVNNLNVLLIILCCLLSLSAITSKAGMNLFSFLVSLSTLYIALKSIQASQFRNIKVILLVSIAIYFSFTITTMAISSNSDDILSYMHRHLYILCIPCLVYVSMFKKSRKSLILAFIVGALISSTYSVYQWSFVNEFNFNIRVTGFLTDFGRHPTGMLLAICMIAPLLSLKNNNLLSTLMISILLLIIMLSIIISGSRGAWLATLMSIFLITIKYYKKHIWKIISIAVISILFISQSFPEQSNKVYQRALSITDTSSNESNTARITMWKGGLDFYTSGGITNQLLGFGRNSTEEKYEEYVLSHDKNERAKFYSNGILFGPTDFHNSFLDMLIRHGLIFTIVVIAIYFYIIYIALKTPNYYMYSSGSFLIGMLFMLPFYSLFQDYTVYIIIIPISIILSEKIRGK